MYIYNIYLTSYIEFITEDFNLLRRAIKYFNLQIIRSNYIITENFNLYHSL